MTSLNSNLTTIDLESEPEPERMNDMLYLDGWNDTKARLQDGTQVKVMKVVLKITGVDIQAAIMMVDGDDRTVLVSHDFDDGGRGEHGNWLAFKMDANV